MSTGFKVWLDTDEDESDARSFEAYDFDEAGRRWALDRDQNGEYSIAKGGSGDIIVLCVRTGERKNLTVLGEFEPSYWTEERS